MVDGNVMANKAKMFKNDVRTVLSGGAGLKLQEQ
jgi:hypothetical protein